MARKTAVKVKENETPIRKPGRPKASDGAGIKAPKKKKVIGFEILKTQQNKISKKYEELQIHLGSFGESLSSFLYEGNKSGLTEAIKTLKIINSRIKEMRMDLKDAKIKAKPVYA